jgi:hypothetical protein
MDLLTCQLIDVVKSLSWTNEREFHHIFPKAFLEANRISPNKINGLAFIMLTSASNKYILKRAHSDYFKEVAGNGEKFETPIRS